MILVIQIMARSTKDEIKAQSKPIKPSKNLVYCYGCKKRKMLFEEKSKADNFIKYNHGGILEEKGKAPVRSYYCELCCGYHVTSILSQEDGERLDSQDSQLLHELTSVTDAMDRFKSLGLDLANRIQDAKDQMYIGCFQEIHDLHEELLPYRDLIQKLPLESKTRFATLFRKADFLFDIALKMDDLIAVPDGELEDYVKHEYPAISEENITTIEIIVCLRKMEQSLLEIGSRSETESYEDYKMKAEEISHYLTSIKPIVGRKVTGAYRRKLGLCN